RIEGLEAGQRVQHVQGVPESVRRQHPTLQQYPQALASALVARRQQWLQLSVERRRRPQPTQHRSVAGPEHRKDADEDVEAAARMSTRVRPMAVSRWPRE